MLATDRMSRLRSVGGAAVLADGSTRQNINYFFLNIQIIICWMEALYSMQISQRLQHIIECSRGIRHMG